jgi:hypothetical protein
MPIVTPPTVVKTAMNDFISPFFPRQPQRDHIANYLTGLMICPNKTITGMTSEQPNASDQSCLNRFMTEVEWDAQKLNEERIKWLQQFDDMKFDERGIIPLDDVLIEKSGKYIKDSGTFWDHSDSRYLHAQDLIIINYVHPTSRKHYPLEFRRFKKAEQCAWTGEQFKKMTELSIELIDWCHNSGVLGTFTFDSFYVSAEILNHINSLKNADGESRGYVADLKFNRKVIFKGVEQQVAEFAKTIPPDARKQVVSSDGTKQWYLSVCVTMRNIGHKVRIVILWRYKNDAEPQKILVSNRIHWNAERIVETYRGRWTGTETFHRDGKQELGLGDCQLRDGEGQTRHVYLVFLAYSLLMRELDKTSVSDWATVKLTTIGESCRAMLRESVSAMITWVIEELDNTVKRGRNATQKLRNILRRLGLATVQ